MTFLRVIWEPVHGQAIPEGKVEKYYEDVLAMLADDDVSVEISTDTMLSRFRLGLVEGDFERMVIIHEDQEIVVGEYGGIPEWPRGLADLSVRLSTRIIRASLAKRKERGVNLDGSPIQPV